MALHRMGSLVVALAILGASLAGTSALAQDVVKIGAPLALTGALADSGKKQKLGFDLWLERVNKGGGISIGAKKYKVELVTYDYQTDGKRAGELAEKLINEDKVSFMIAPFGSGHTKITAAVAERYGVPIVAVASSEAVHDQGFKYLFGTRDECFLVALGDTLQERRRVRDHEGVLRRCGEGVGRRRARLCACLLGRFTDCAAEGDREGRIARSRAGA